MPDVNVLVYAHREDSHAEHPRFAAWVTSLATGPQPFALSLLALVGFVRVVTNPRVFRQASTLDQALEFTGELVLRPTARLIAPGPQHWELVTDLCRATGATGKLVADAQHAACGGDCLGVGIGAEAAQAAYGVVAEGAQARLGVAGSAPRAGESFDGEGDMRRERGQGIDALLVGAVDGVGAVAPERG